MTQGTLRVPQGWRNADPFYDAAMERVQTALRDPRTPERLTRFYSRTGDFAGSMFTRIGDTDPHSITESDLLAVTLLGVTAPPSMVRALLEDGPTRTHLNSLLSADRLPVDLRLEDVTAEHLQAMDELYTSVRALVPPPVDRYEVNWVAAARLCSRKRPDLFPGRSEDVCRYLDLWPSRYQVDWQVFHAIMSDEQVRADIERLVGRVAESDSVDVGDPGHLLHHLDVILWMHAPHRS